MKLIECLGISGIFVGALLFPQSALAYLQLTYTSNELPFIQGYLGTEPDDTVGSGEPPYPAFKVVFKTQEGGLSNTFASGNVTMEFPFGSDYPLGNVNADSSNITLTADGHVASWYFNLSLTQFFPASENNPPDRTSWLIASAYGANTCNCDRYQYESDLYIQRPYDTWQYANTLGFLYGNDNSPGTWTVEKIDLPEPQSYLLFFTGFAVVYIMRRRKKI